MNITTSRPRTTGPRPVDLLPEEPRELNPRAGFGSLETTRGLLPLTALDVSAHIQGLSAEVLVRQTFVNPFSEHLEATYIFPLPDRAAVNSFRLTVAGRTIVGDLKERGEARQEYDRAIQAGHRAAIAEEDRSGVFSLRVGNLPPLEQATVEISLVGPLVFVDGEATFRFPLVVAPRYVPGNFLDVPPVGPGTSFDTDQVPDASRVTPPVLLPGFPNPVLLPGFPNPVRLGLSVEFNPGGLVAPEGGWVGALKSSLHGVLEESDGQTVRLRVQPGERLNRDFILRFPAAQRSVQTSLVASSEGTSDRPRTFALTLVPPINPEAPPAPRDVVFVLDRSGSMGGWKMVAARRALGRMIDTLNDRDRFTVLAFDDSLEMPPSANSQLMAGSNRERWQTLEWLGKVDSRGGTEMGPALQQAVQLLAGAPTADRGGKAESILVLVTDGQVAGEDVLLKTLTKAAGKRMPRIFALGIDRSVNAGFLKRLADLGHGANDLVESEERLDEVMDRIHRAIATPALVDVRLEPLGCEWLGDSLAPSRLPDLFAGAPLTIYGRFLGDSAGLKLRVHAHDAAGNPWTQDLQATWDQTRVKGQRTDMLLNLWGRAKVRELEDRYAAGVDSDLRSLAARIVKVSLESHVLSRFTAYVAVDLAEVVNQGGEQREMVQPVEQPEGWASLAAAPAPMQAMCLSAPVGAAGARQAKMRSLGKPQATAKPVPPPNARGAGEPMFSPSMPLGDVDGDAEDSVDSCLGGNLDEAADAVVWPMDRAAAPREPMAKRRLRKGAPGAGADGLVEKAKSAFGAIADAAGAMVNAMLPHGADKQAAGGKQDARAESASTPPASEAQLQSKDQKMISGGGSGGVDEPATTLRLLLDEPAPQGRRTLLEKLLEELARLTIPSVDAALADKLQEIRESGLKLAARYDGGEVDLLTSDEFRTWSERVITLLTALNPAEPVALPDRPQFWV